MDTVTLVKVARYAQVIAEVVANQMATLVHPTLSAVAITVCTALADLLIHGAAMDTVILEKVIRHAP